MTPTARSIKFLKDSGYRVARVEHWLSFAKIRQDLFGVADLLGMKRDEPLVAVQVTTMSNLAKRQQKDPETVAVWLSTGNRFIYHGWSKKGPRGKRKTWQLVAREAQR